MAYPTAKLIAEMGYAAEVYELIKDTKITNPKAVKLIELADQLKSNIKYNAIIKKREVERL